MPKQRTVSKKSVFDRILILCEGKTEKLYFDDLKRDNNKKLPALKIVIHNTEKNTNRELVQEAIELRKRAQRDRNPFSKVWVVVDKNGYTKHNDAFQLAYSKKIEIAFSSISFEFWVLIHFEYTTRPFENSGQLIHYIKTKQYISDYKKPDSYYYLIKDKIENAIKNAKQIAAHHEPDLRSGNKKIYELNPYTDVYKLVEYLCFR